MIRVPVYGCYGDEALGILALRCTHPIANANIKQTASFLTLTGFRSIRRTGWVMKQAILLIVAAGAAQLGAGRVNEYVMLPGHKRLEHVVSPRVSPMISHDSEDVGVLVFGCPCAVKGWCV